VDSARFRGLALVGLALMLAPARVLANPRGGMVRAGSATIVGQGTGQVDVYQHTPEALLSWEQFDIGASEVTNFHQPGASSVAINRILDQNPSQIFGSINANGNVYLINPNGFLFGPNASINTHGFSASASLDAEKLAKLTGGFDPSAEAAPGATIENHGSIRVAEGGFVYMVAPRVENGDDGVITTPEGEVYLAAGATVTLTDDPRGLGLAVEYTAPAGGEAVNLGRLVADGGLARIRADRILQGGLVQADAIREQSGRIELYASSDLSLEPGSLLSASGGRNGDGGEIRVYSEGDAAMRRGAAIDVSGGARGGDGGSAELSAAGRMELGGELRAGAAHGASGAIRIDPSEVVIPDGIDLRGSPDVGIEADDLIELADGARIRLHDPSQVGDGSAGEHDFTLRSGGDIDFGSGSQVVDDGSGPGVWNVNLLAGDDLRLDGGALVALTHGDITVRTGLQQTEANRGDVRISGSTTGITGLRTETGSIDIAAGGSVIFSSTNRSALDSVIETGSGDIAITAGFDPEHPDEVAFADSAGPRGGVDLGRGNAAIRTRGVTLEVDGRAERRDGGSIQIRAAGDVNAGNANRWLGCSGINCDPGLDVSQDLLEQIARNQDLPPPPVFAPLPVVPEGILGIGTEVGGDVAIVAGGDVLTGTSDQGRSGATASGLGVAYNGSHIGVFGQPVFFAPDPLTGVLRPAPLPDAPASRLTVVAGGRIRGDYMVRGGEAVLRAGYALGEGVGIADLAHTAQVDASLIESAGAQADASQGWAGTLADPLTVDLIGASVDAAGRNGVALRAAENPTLVYPPNGDRGSFRVPTYGPGDTASLSSSHGDVILLGHEIDLPQRDVSASEINQLVRLLPPNVQIRTERGDLVLLNDFLIYPSAEGGLLLDVAGTVRTANGVAVSPAELLLDVRTAGASGDVSFTLDPGVRFRDPKTGLEFVLRQSVDMLARLPAQSATGSVVFRAAADAVADEPIVIPRFTEVATQDGRVYRTTAEQVILPAAQRFSTGTVTFVLGATAQTQVAIGPGVEFVAPDGTRFRTVSSAVIDPGERSATATVRALTAGSDASAYSLTLVRATLPSGVAGRVEQALNLATTSRPPEVAVPVEAVEPGLLGNAPRFLVAGLLDPIPGIVSVSNPQPLARGIDLAPTGFPIQDVLARSEVFGPVGELPVGTRLVIADPSVLPPGVDPDELSIEVQTVNLSASLAPALLQEVRNGSPDLPVGADPFVRDENGNPVLDENGSPVRIPIWQRTQSGVAATIRQSDAAPSFDGRSLNSGTDYYTYFLSCRSGAACTPAGGVALGDGPPHAGDLEPAVLRAVGGFDRATFELARPAFVLTGDPGPDRAFGTADDGPGGDLIDFSLLVQHTDAAERSIVWAPLGDANLGAPGPDDPIHPDPLPGIQVSGPGGASLWVGVLPSSSEGLPDIDLSALREPVDLAGSVGDRNGDGRISPDEFRGDPEVFAELDTAERVFDSPYSFVQRAKLIEGDGALDPDEAPFVPSGLGGRIALADVPASSAIGIESIGNLRNPVLALGGADLQVIAAREILLGQRGSIASLQGGRILVQSVTSRVEGGDPPEGFTGKRGIFSLYSPDRGTGGVIDDDGGGAIFVDVHGDGPSGAASFDLGHTALATLSGGDIFVLSRAGSIDAGESTPFELLDVFTDARTGLVTVNFEGGGIFSEGGNVKLLASQDVRIGAGITGAGITIEAGGDVVAGQGSISASGNVSIDAGGSVGGSISAGGSVSVSGDASSASFSAGGLVSGAGSVASNTGSGKVSSELSSLDEKAAEADTGLSGFGGTAAATANGSRGVVIRVTSEVCDKCA
jgi:filamentous hemagglutinin family protein